jgi:WD40 repeat protein
VTHAAFDRDGQRIVVACADGSIRIWDLAGIAPPEPSRETEISRDGKWGLAISNNVVEIQNNLAAETPPTLIRADDPVKKAEFSGNGQFVSTVASAKMANGQTNQMARVWNTVSGAPVGPAIVFTNALDGISASDNGRHLIVFGDSDAQIWNTHTGQPQSSVLKHDDQIRQAFFRPNNQQVATVSGRQVNVWNVLTGQASFPPLEHKQPVNYAEYSPNGAQLVSCCTDSSYTKCYAQIWDAATGNPVEPPLFHNDGVLSARFSPDGQRVATASEDFTAALWDAASGRQLTVPALQHDEKVNSAAFSPNGKWVVTASVDKTARVWSAETGEPLMPPLRGVSAMNEAIFLADGRRVATFDQRGLVLLWNLPVDRRPVADLGKLSRLLSGDLAAASGPFARAQSESLAEIWKELKAKYPSDFQTSTAEIITWNKAICRRSEYEQQWAAAVFHLRLLAQMNPGDAAVQSELSAAEKRVNAL